MSTHSPMLSPSPPPRPALGHHPPSLVVFISKNPQITRPGPQLSSPKRTDGETQKGSLRPQVPALENAACGETRANPRAKGQKLA